MTFALVAFAALLPSQPPAEPTAAELIAAAFKHYYDAKSLYGRIHLTESAANYTISVDTDLAYERPSKLYINQRRSGNNPAQWLAVSDGNIFSYNKPQSVHGPARFREPVVQADGRVQTVPEMYAALRKGSIEDYSPVLDMAIANPDLLAALKAHWLSMHRAGTAKVRDQDVNVIAGEFAPVSGQGAAGQFEMDLSPAGDVLRYTRKSRYAVPQHPGQTIDVIDNWEAELKVNVPVDPKIYRGG